MAYTKLFDSLWSGSLYGQFEASAVFMVFLSIANQDGEVDMTPEAIAGRTGWPLEFIKKGIEQLEAEDSRSRTPDANGRRIIRMDEHRPWGWFITNHEKYREAERTAERREYMKMAKRKEREAKKSKLSNKVNTVSNVNLSDQISSDQIREDQSERESTPTPKNVSRGTNGIVQYGNALCGGSEQDVELLNQWQKDIAGVNVDALQRFFDNCQNRPKPKTYTAGERILNAKKLAAMGDLAKQARIVDEVISAGHVTLYEPRSLKDQQSAERPTKSYEPGQWKIEIQKKFDEIGYDAMTEGDQESYRVMIHEREQEKLKGTQNGR